MACSLSPHTSSSTLDRLQGNTSTDSADTVHTPNMTVIYIEGDNKEISHVEPGDDELSAVEDRLAALHTAGEPKASLNAALLPATPLSLAQPRSSTPELTTDILSADAEERLETFRGGVEKAFGLPRDGEIGSEASQHALEETPLWQFGPDLGPHRILCTLIKQQIHISVSCYYLVWQL